MCTRAATFETYVHQRILDPELSAAGLTRKITDARYSRGQGLLRNDEGCEETLFLQRLAVHELVKGGCRICRPESKPVRNLLGVQWELQFDEQATIRNIYSSDRAPMFADNAFRDGQAKTRSFGI